mmetsp:Transcript_4809/g.7739  ORF Transcript_4809/g.7739 Transcript_4809/m.7739 type:complete len:256 (-) Transcript_4809:1584-2351(-)
MQRFRFAIVVVVVVRVVAAQFEHERDLRQLAEGVEHRFAFRVAHADAGEHAQHVARRRVQQRWQRDWHAALLAKRDGSAAQSTCQRRRDVGQRGERTIVKPARLLQHLHERHDVECGAEPAGVGSHVDHGLQHTNGLPEHRARVSGIVGHRQRTTRHIALQQDVGLDVRIVVDRRHFVATVDRQLFVRQIFVVTHGKLVKLGGIGQRLEQRVTRRIFADLVAQQPHGAMREIIVRRHVSQHTRFNFVTLFFFAVI